MVSEVFLLIDISGAYANVDGKTGQRLFLTTMNLAGRELDVRPFFLNTACQQKKVVLLLVRLLPRPLQFVL